MPSTTGNMGPAITRWRVSAWWLSVATHAGLLILAAILLKWFSSTAPRGLEEETRQVAVALARRQADRPTEYYTEPLEPAAVAAQSAATHASAKGEQSTADALPAEAELALPVSTALPTAGALPVGDATSLLPTLQASAGGGRPRLATDEDDAAILAADPLRNGPPVVAKGPPGTVSVFGVPAVGHRFVMLIDRSSSMGDSGLAVLGAAERELNAALAGLGPEHQFQLVAYNQRRQSPEPNGPEPATDAHKLTAAQFLAGVVADGGTEHLPALLAAFRTGADVIYVMTDGGEPVLSQPQLQRITQANQAKATVHCLEFGRGPLTTEDPFLKRLARYNGGTYRYVDVGKW